MPRGAGIRASGAGRMRGEERRGESHEEDGGGLERRGFGSWPAAERRRRVATGEGVARGVVVLHGGRVVTAGSDCRRQAIGGRETLARAERERQEGRGEDQRDSDPPA